MTSSLRSRFDFFDRRAVYLGAEKLSVFHWRGGALTDSLDFEWALGRQEAFEWQGREGGVAQGIGGGLGEAALAQFESYLREAPGEPVYLLVDVMEEEYRHDTIPHVFGADRRALLERKLERLFRGTPYRYAELQGRETEGRRDDRVLLTALSNPALIGPLLELFARYRVPLAGIYSVPLISGALLGRLGVKGTNVLLVTLHAASGLRQSFFRDRCFKVSRLAKMPRFGTVPYAPYLLGEIDKVRRYLNSLRLMAREVPLEVWVLASGELLADLKAQCLDSEQLRYALVDVAELGGRLGVSGALTTPYSDVLFAHLLLAQRPRNQYADGEQRRYYQLYKGRLAMMAASVLLLLSASVWSGFNFIEGVALRQQGLSAKEKAEYYEKRYEKARQRLPATPVRPEEVKQAVSLVEALERRKATPVALMQTVSRALAGFPEVRLERMEWMASSDPQARLEAPGRAGATAAAVEVAAQAPTGARPGDGPATGGEFLYYQIAELSGRIEPFESGDYRKALDLIGRFTEALRAEQGVQQVEVVSLPLDLSSAASLQGSAGEEPNATSAGFSVRVVLGVGRGSG